MWPQRAHPHRNQPVYPAERLSRIKTLFRSWIRMLNRIQMQKRIRMRIRSLPGLELQAEEAAFNELEGGIEQTDEKGGLSADASR